MRTIIRSQLYQLKRMKFAFVIYLLFVLFLFRACGKIQKLTDF